MIQHSTFSIRRQEKPSKFDFVKVTHILTARKVHSHIQMNEALEKGTSSIPSFIPRILEAFQAHK
jgi:hypothetical protein